MRDPGDLPRLLTRDLGDVRWPEPAEIRARGRRRTVRTVAATPLVLAVLLASVWLLVGPSREDAAPPPGGGSTPTPTPTPSSPADALDLPPGWFGPDVLLQPEDVGEGFALDNEHAFAPGEYPTWAFGMSQCPAYEGLKIKLPIEYTWMRINIVARSPGTASDGDVHAELTAYPAGGAERVMVDARRVVAACREFSYIEEETRTEVRVSRAKHEFAVVDEGFAGDDALMTRQRTWIVDADTGEKLSEVVVELVAAVRVGDRVEVLTTYLDDPARLREVAVRAAGRL